MVRVELTRPALDALAIDALLTGHMFIEDVGPDGKVKIDDLVMVLLQRHRRSGESFSDTIIRLFNTG